MCLLADGDDVLGDLFAGGGEEGGEGLGVLDGVGAGVGAAEGCEGGTAAEVVADVVRESADVGAFATGDGKAGVGEVDVGEFEAGDGDGAGFAGDVFSTAGGFIEALAVDLDGADHGGDLLGGAGEGGDLGLDVGGGDVLPGSLGEDVAVEVLGVGCDAEAEGAEVGFVAAHDGVGEFGAAAEEDDEESGGGGVEGAAVADLAHLEVAAEFGDDVVGGPAGGFVDEEEAVVVHISGRG